MAVSTQFVPCIRCHHWLNSTSQLTKNFKFIKTPKMCFRTSAFFWTYSFFYMRISSGLQLQQQQNPCQWKLIWVKNQEVASVPSTAHLPDNFALDWLRNFWNCLPPVQWPCTKSWGWHHNYMTEADNLQKHEKFCHCKQIKIYSNKNSELCITNILLLILCKEKKKKKKST